MRNNAVLERFFVNNNFHGGIYIYGSMRVLQTAYVLNASSCPLFQIASKPKRRTDIWDNGGLIFISGIRSKYEGGHLTLLCQTPNDTRPAAA